MARSNNALTNEIMHRQTDNLCVLAHPALPKFYTACSSPIALLYYESPLLLQKLYFTYTLHTSDRGPFKNIRSVLQKRL